MSREDVFQPPGKHHAGRVTAEQSDGMPLGPERIPSRHGGRQRQRLGSATAALIQCPNEPVLGLHFLQLLGLSPGEPTMTEVRLSSLTASLKA
jgi:hypothetical protein